MGLLRSPSLIPLLPLHHFTSICPKKAFGYAGGTPVTGASDTYSPLIIFLSAKQLAQKLNGLISHNQSPFIFDCLRYTRYMNCPICTGGRNIPIDQLKEHLIRGQHQMDKDIASYIVYLLEKIEKLEKKA